jgi:hypothetical protein
MLAALSRGGAAPSEPARVVRDALLDVLSTDDPELRQGFRNLVREEQAVLRDEQRERRQTQWEEQTSTRLATFRRDNGLTQDQEDGLFALLTAARDRTGELFRGARESDAPPSRVEVRARMDAIRKETDGEVRELLDARQFDAFQKLQEEEGLLGPTRRDGRRQPAPDR